MGNIDNSIYGGPWGNHPKYTVEMWMHEVSNDETRRGYWEWVEAQIESNKSEEE